MQLDQWAAKHNVSAEALAELKQLFVQPAPDAKPTTLPLSSEAAVQQVIRLEAAPKGIRIWRNNVGVLKDERGVPVRFGLCNDSKKINEQIKSSDLIGIRPVLIQPHMVGMTIGQFVAREVKAPNWKLLSGDKRAQAQLRFIQLVQSLGGDACFATGGGTL